MNTKTKIPRFVFALALALSALGISASAALAAQPVKWEFTFSVPDIPLTDVCSFPIWVTVNITIHGIDFFDESGALTRSFQHYAQQDTFTANGKTLVGIPYTYNMEFLIDSSGTAVHIYADGVFEKVPLPDGSLFISAGRADFAAHPGQGFLLSPDKGNPGNVAGFCAALAP